VLVIAGQRDSVVHEADLRETKPITARNRVSARKKPAVRGGGYRQEGPGDGVWSALISTVSARPLRSSESQASSLVEQRAGVRHADDDKA